MKSGILPKTVTVFPGIVLHCLACLILLIFNNITTLAEDWPTYRHDNRRSGVTAEELQLPLKPIWCYTSPTPPQTAWAGPAKWDAYAGIRGLKSMRDFDSVFHVSVVNSHVYFGSSVEDCIICLDADTGVEKWSFPADGPVRLPPSVYQDRLYFGSDDGYAYCIQVKDRALNWKYKAAGETQLVPSNGKLISLWPVRTGVLIMDHKAYFAASLLPWQNTYLCALDASSGADSGAGLYKVNFTDLTLQGSLLASANRLFSPQGRSAPILFKRVNGEKIGALKGGGGGIFAILTKEENLIHGPGNKTGWLHASESGSRESIVSFAGARRMVITRDIAYLLGEKKLSAFDRVRYLELQRQKNELIRQQNQIQARMKKLGKDAEGDEVQELKAGLDRIKKKVTQLTRLAAQCFLWEKPSSYPCELILAGKTLFAGGDGAVAAFNTNDGTLLWQSTVDGKGCGLAVADGRLFVSTDKGKIYCFMPK